MWQAVKELIEGAYIGQAIIATMLVVSACILVINGQEVPEWFVGLVATVVVWYFREQTTARYFRQENRKEKAAKLTSAS